MQSLLYSGALQYARLSFIYCMFEFAPCSITTLGPSGMLGLKLGMSTRVNLRALMDQRAGFCINNHAPWLEVPACNVNAVAGACACPLVLSVSMR